MVQNARPTSDVQAGAWTNQAGSGTSLYQSVDEATEDDTDFLVSSAAPNGDTLKLGLGTVTDPGGNTGYVVRYAIGKQGTDRVDKTVWLMQGPTQIASWTHTDIPAGPTVFAQTLTAAQADAIVASGGNLASLQLWDVADAPFDPRTSVPWDAAFDGDDLAGADGAAVATWTDFSGHGRDATQATGANQPAVQVTSPLNGHRWALFDGTNDCLQIASFTPPATGKATCYVVAKNSASVAILAESSANAFANSGTLILDVESSSLNAGMRPSANQATLHGDTVGTGWRVYAGRYDDSVRKTKATPLVDGKARTGTLTANSPADTGNFSAYAVNIGSRNQASFFLNGGIAWWSLAFALHPPQTMRKMVAALSAKYGLGIVDAKGVVVADGDSNVDANDISNTLEPFCNVLMDRFTDPYDFANYGVGGQGIGTTGIAGTCAYDAATQIDPWINPNTPGRNILFVWATTNDLYTPTSGSNPWNGATKETALTRLQDYLTARVAAGWQTVPLTILPNNNPGWDATAQADFMATERPYINGWITGSAVSGGYAAAVVDLTGDANLENENNTTYYHTDKSHLTQTGQSLVADYAETVVGTLGVT